MKRNAIAYLAAFALLASAVGAQDTIFETNGDLSSGDTLGSDGSYQDLHLIGVTAATTIQVVVESDDFDSYVDALLPGERRIRNDDFDGTNAGFIHTVERSGTMQLTVRSVFGSSGAYRLVVISRSAQPSAAASVATASSARGRGSPWTGARVSGSRSIWSPTISMRSWS